MHVDGFRFDLATILTRRLDGTLDTNDPAVISDITADPALSELRLVAEAWPVRPRRVPAHAGRSREPLRPGQRDELGRLVEAPRQRGHGAICPGHDTGLPSPKDLVSTELRAPLATLSRHVVARSVVILEAAIGQSPSMQNATL
jgi:hypothetical protein